MLLALVRLYSALFIACCCLFFFVTLPFLGMEILENIFIEIITILISFTAGSWALYCGYRKYRKTWLLILFTAGIFLLIISVAFTINRSAELILKSMAAIAIVTAHVFNIKFSKHSMVYKNEKRQRTPMLKEIKY